MYWWTLRLLLCFCVLAIENSAIINIRVHQSDQFLSHIQLLTPWTTALQASLCIINTQSLFKLKSRESVMTSNHLILCHPLLLLPSIFPSIRVFSKDSVLCIRWPKYWSFSFSISPSNEYSGLISFKMVWSSCSPRDSQETSPTPQLKSINSLVLSDLAAAAAAFFIIQFSHPSLRLLLFQCLGYCKQCYNKHWVACFFSN